MLIFVAVCVFQGLLALPATCPLRCYEKTLMESLLMFGHVVSVRAEMILLEQLSYIILKNQCWIKFGLFLFVFRIVRVNRLVKDLSFFSIVLTRKLPVKVYISTVLAVNC